jgi:hypothetical protein
MDLITISVQSSEEKESCIIWGMDLKTKLLVKVHMQTCIITELDVGDGIEIQEYKRIKRQEIWVDYFRKITIDQDLDEILEMKAATPFSIIEPAFIGNIAKVEEVIEVDRNTVVARLLGFPKEIKYLQMHDYKWNKFMKDNLNDNNMSDAIKKDLNSRKKKYIIIDFPNEYYKGHVQVAALVVV